MTRIETIDKLESAINLELDNAKSNGERYNSNHEFYGVYLEEFEELKEEMENLQTYSNILWDEVRMNQDLYNNLKVMRCVIRRVLSEASQVAAVIEKEIEGIERWK